MLLADKEQVGKAVEVLNQEVFQGNHIRVDRAFSQKEGADGK